MGMVCIWFETLGWRLLDAMTNPTPWADTNSILFDEPARFEKIIAAIFISCTLHQR